MINGAHTIIYSSNPDADRAFFRDVLEFNHVDAGDGWLIFALPKSELAVYPADGNDVHELFFMCDDVGEFRGEMSARGIVTSDVEILPWGLLTRMTLPGGGSFGVYEPRHQRPA